MIVIKQILVLFIVPKFIFYLKQKQTLIKNINIKHY